MSNVLPKIFHGRGYTNDMKAHEKVFNILSHEGSENLNQWDITTHLSEWLKLKVVPTPNVDKNAKKPDHSPIADRNVKYYTFSGK